MKLFLTSISILLLSCQYGESSHPTKVQYMPDMADSPTVKAQENILMPPDNAVPMNRALYFPDKETAERLMPNPLDQMRLDEDKKQEHVKNGKVMYETFCIPCHGPAGKGNGTVVDKFPRPQDITTEAYVNRKDGFFFHVITFGGAIMPGYGHAIDELERWQIVYYLRQLQEEGAK